MSEKLIRDLVRQRFEAPDDDYRIAAPSEMFDLLLDKLREETEELATSREVEELADIEEVVLGLADALSTRQALEDVRRSKLERAGGFEQRIVWVRAPSP